MHVAVAEAGQRTEMGDIEEIDEKTLFSEAYHLHKISICERRGKRKWNKMERTKDKTVPCGRAASGTSLQSFCATANIGTSFYL